MFWDKYTFIETVVNGKKVGYFQKKGGRSKPTTDEIAASLRQLEAEATKKTNDKKGEDK